MWMGLAATRLRKDWKEAYHFEQDLKPFDLRGPGGHFSRSEERTFGHNVVYPEGFDLENWAPEKDVILAPELTVSQMAGGVGHLKTDTIVVNLDRNTRRRTACSAWTSRSTARWSPSSSR